MHFSAALPRISFFVLLSAALWAGETAQAKLRTEYTSLETKNCKALKSGAEDSYAGRCKGVAGYQLELLEGDLRQSLNIINPAKKKTELNLWHSVSGGFSTIGDKAEWRLENDGKKDIPRALIVRFNASENPEDSTKITSYLVVIKITAGEICVTDIVKPKAKQNEEARSLSDTAAHRPCKKSE